MATHRYPLTIALAVLLLTAATIGQDIAQTSAPATEQGPDLETVDARIAELDTRDQAGELDDEGKTRLELYRQARASLREAEASKKQRAGFEDAAARAPAELEAVQAALAQPPVDLLAEPPPEATLAQLREGLGQAQSDLAAAQEGLSNAQEESQRRETRRPKIGEELTQAQQTRGEVQQSLAALPRPDESAALTEARRAKLRAQLRALEEWIGLLEQERRSYEAQRELLPLQREQLSRRAGQLEKLVNAWQELVDKARAADIQRQQEEAAHAATLAHPLVAPIAEANVALAARRDELQPLRDQAQKELAELQPEPDAIKSDLDGLREMVKVVGMTSTVGLMLRRSQAGLPDVAVHLRSIKQRQAIMTDAEFERLRLEDEYDTVVAYPERVVQDILTKLGPEVADAERATIEQELREQLRIKREYLTSLNEDLRGYFGQLQALNEKEGKIVELTEEIDEFISERILWTRSAGRLGVGDLPRAFAALRWSLSPTQWRAIGRAAWSYSGTTWPVIILTVIGVAVLVAIRNRLGVRIRRIADEVSRPATNTFGRTAKVTLYSVLRAAIWPVILWSVGTWLFAASAEGAIELGRALGGALRGIAILLFVLELLIEICHPQGLGEAHFRWRPANLRMASRNLVWLTWVIIPLGLLVAVMHKQSHHDHEASLGRLVFIATMMAVAVFSQRVLNPTGGITESYLSRNRGGWLDRLRFLWYPLAFLVPISLAAASFLGYHYTAVELFRPLMESVFLVVLVALGHGILLRWLFVAQQRLALAEAAKRRAAYEEKRARGEEAGDAPPPAEEPSVDVSAVGAQTHQLLRGLVLFTFLIGFWLIWAETLPAIGFLRGVELWAGPQAPAAAAQAAAAGVELTIPMITLEDLLFALVVLVVTIVVSKNIPGLLEITILQRLPLERGSQFAISTITRYTISIVGAVVAFGLIGVTWSKVQWMAAAITVGLGFGLQEIFANFVSGLIILFERPIRVGDTVTIGTVHGTVSQIRIRSTTVIDWDRKEMVIPNKEFVTSSIINWTLSDPILRVVVPVGIAYGSDTTLAEKLLLEAARDNPLVLDDPPPTVMFGKFGDSALEFDLRVFVPNIDQLIRVRHALHNTIDQAFRKAGIKIAFPQRDIHIRSVKDGVPIDFPTAAAAED